MNMNQYQALASRTINKELRPEEALLHALHGMASEVGEIHGIFQKCYQGHELKEEHLIKEVGDLLWFVAEFCTAIDVDLEAVARTNIDKLMKRYPDGFAAENSLNRKDGDV